ncbi:MAG: hypothetical protein JW821_15810 [Deltaproteobacteria bacterium]|nr:hypothetical protein [Deltaproteobacteria bacterium]
MTHEYKGHFADKHGKDQEIDPRITEAIRERVAENEVPCAVAFTIVEDLKVEPMKVGRAIDQVEKSITKCQLGLFGYGPQKSTVKPVETVDAEMEKAVRNRLENGRLPCKEAWDIAKAFGLRKMQITSACEKLGIKICHCQLGTF